MSSNCHPPNWHCIFMTLTVGGLRTRCRDWKQESANSTPLPPGLVGVLIVQAPAGILRRKISWPFLVAWDMKLGLTWTNYWTPPNLRIALPPEPTRDTFCWRKELALAQ